MILNRDEIINLMGRSNIESSLIITPLLDSNEQINLTSVDLRLGCEFLVSVQTREPLVDWAEESRPVGTFFQETYRDVGERFILYPGQLVLAHTFEYIKIPDDIFCSVVTRSSWHRVGLSINGIVQPGYRGTISLELFNHSQNSIVLYPGIRIVQIILHQTVAAADGGYINRQNSKYVANITNQVAALTSDKEINKLLKFNPN